MPPIAFPAIDFATAYVPFGVLCLATILCCGIWPNWRLFRLASGTPKSRQAGLSLALQLLSFCNMFLLTLLFAVRSFFHGQPGRAGVVMAALVAPQVVTAISLIVVSIKLMRLRRVQTETPQG